MLHDNGGALAAADPPPASPGSGVKHMGALKFWKRDSRELRPMPNGIAEGDDVEEVKLVLHLSGEALLESGGRAQTLTPSSWGLYAFSKSCRIKGPYSQLVVSMPKRLLAARNPNLDRVMKRQFSAESPAMAMAFRFFTSLYDNDSSGTAFAHELGDIGIRLLQVALDEQQARLEGHTRQEKFRSRIKSFVDTHLHDPGLSVEAIARANHCSTRYLQKMFGDAESIGRYLWRMRLERCSAALADPCHAHRSITEIAFSLGFSNPSHFSRVFRARYGTTPREYRALMLEKAAETNALQRPMKADCAA
ncbi:helix-turn-helix domain-containing protein [Parasphingopyxis marina]|uniref:Helix-turn-helix domain-containing protein n=1 Tax=Parasphingopyxis marina TaxID=2761622 RepID=A0A842HYM2_9SPHN|nr:helix-turn-helix domain-containing protein [Parasphingopyxis marina]MBC2777020.1 helix-turn-helix domain-containing protein [Parasphingopyxis marina]